MAWGAGGGGGRGVVGVVGAGVSRTRVPETAVESDPVVCWTLPGARIAVCMVQRVCGGETESGGGTGGGEV